jgi:hypothetical protein
MAQDAEPQSCVTVRLWRSYAKQRPSQATHTYRLPRSYCANPFDCMSSLVYDTIHSSMPSPRDDRRSQDWFPDWLPYSAHRTSTETHPTSEYSQSGHPTSGFDNYRLLDVSNGPSSTNGEIGTIEENIETEEIPPPLPGDVFTLERNRDRAVKYASITDNSSAILTVL